MRVRFWGVRGSIAKPGPTTVRHGGNTSCVEVRCDDGTLVVLDAGTGLQELGRALLDETARDESLPRRGHLLISHTHWDHIQGFPFFGPLFSKGWEWDIHAPGEAAGDLERALSGQMAHRYFPVTLDALCATIRFHDLGEGTFRAGGCDVRAFYLNHPASCLGYRVSAGQASVVYSTDHEPHSPHRPDDGLVSSHAEDRRHVAHLEDAALVIHDAQYTEDEYASRVGWGHSPAERAVSYAAAAGARRLALFHHEPFRTDDELDALVARCRSMAGRAAGSLEVFAAVEGEQVELSEGARERGEAGAGGTAELASPDPPAHCVLVVEDEPAVLEVIEQTLGDSGLETIRAVDGAAALSLLQERRPSLVLLDARLPGVDGLEVCRRVRASEDPELARVPIVMMSGKAKSAKDIEQGFAAGVSDYLLKPFQATYLLSRTRAWLKRSEAGRQLVDA